VALVLSFTLVSLPETWVLKAESKTIIVPDDYFTIQDAIGNASEGDTVFVKSGIYIENLTINKSLSLVGEDKETTTVVGDGTTALLVQHDNVNVTGFTFKRPTTMRWYYGIHLLSAKHCNIFGNILESTFRGIWLFDASFNYIYENNCTRNYYGIHLGDSNYNYVSKNWLTRNTGSGISTEGSNSNIIIDNYIASNGWAGINLDGGKPNSDNLIVKNVVTQNADVGICISSSNSSNRIVNNTITANGHPDNENPFAVAILLYVGNNLIERNQIIANQAGIYIWGSCNSTIRWNIIKSNSKGGIRIHSAPTQEALNNVFYENNIINNDVFLSGLQESNKTNIWDLNSRGNYWSSYTGTDNDNDGIGDTPHAIGQNNADNYPLMEPVDTEIISEFPSWAFLLIMLTAILAVAVVYRHRLHKHSRRRFDGI
jgi:nitrous oxidase accessory protein